MIAYTSVVLARAIWTFVLFIWLTGPLAGAGCLRAGPEPAATTATAGKCHETAPDTALSNAHDCGTHVAPSSESAVTQLRQDISPVLEIFEVSTARRPRRSLIAIAPAAGRSSVPISFQTPLRQ